MGRSVPEWIGATPDVRVPTRVRLRIFEAHGGRCALTGAKIQAGDMWDLDHIVPLALGGEHRESNLQPALRTAHRAKTREDRKAIDKAKRCAANHTGAKREKRSRLPGSRDSKWKQKVGGGWVPREG